MNEQFFLGILGSVRNATVAVCTARGVILCATPCGPLALRANDDLRIDLQRALTQLALHLRFRKLEDLAAATSQVCVAMPGLIHDGDRFLVRRALTYAGLYKPESPPVICEDIWADLAAAGEDEGICIVASSGANVLVSQPEGSFTVGGWGSELGDLGSGFHLGKLALRAILDDYDERSPVTPLFRSALLSATGIASPAQLVSWFDEVRRAKAWRAKIADLAITVVALAEEHDDRSAKAILGIALHELQRTVEVAIKRAHRNAESKTGRHPHRHSGLSVVLAGGLGVRSSTYRDTLRERVNALSLAMTSSPNDSAHLRFRVSNTHPMIGTLCFAIAGGQRLPTRRVYDALLESAQALPATDRPDFLHNPLSQ